MKLGGEKCNLNLQCGSLYWVQAFSRSGSSAIEGKSSAKLERQFTQHSLKRIPSIPGADISRAPSQASNQIVLNKWTFLYIELSRVMRSNHFSIAKYSNYIQELHVQVIFTLPATVFWWMLLLLLHYNHLIALLQALFALVLLNPSSECAVVFWVCVCACVCARPLPVTKPYLRPFQAGSCAWFSPFLLYTNHTCVLVCVCLYMREYKCVMNVINFHTTCSFEVEIEINILSDVK